jgi:prepilin-type N-terminal cleavage/methylation domain-containing protein
MENMVSSITIDRGYTLIEVLVGLALFGAVALPLALFFSSVVAKAVDDDTLNASAIASNIMEQLIATRDIRVGKTEVNYGGKRYFVLVQEQIAGDLTEVRVSAGRSNEDRELFRLYRLFYRLGNATQ